MRRMKLNLKCRPGLWCVLALTLLTGVAQAKEFVSVDRPEIMLRSGAGTEHLAIWAFSQGYPLEVTGHKGNWLKVRDFENDTGWVYRKLVSKTPHVIVKSTSANIRKSPSRRSHVLGQAAYGDVLRHLEHSQGWIKVERNDGLKGWIARKLLWGW